jgi:hypothetical protein
LAYGYWYHNCPWLSLRLDFLLFLLNKEYKMYNIES